MGTRSGVMPSAISIWPGVSCAEAANAGRDRWAVGDREVGSGQGHGRNCRAATRRGHSPLGCLRKHLFDVNETTALPQEAYQAETSQRVYDLLSKTAMRVLAQGCSVILDAAFLRESQRAGLSDLARRHHARFVGLFLTADLATRLSGSNGESTMRQTPRGMSPYSRRLPGSAW